MSRFFALLFILISCAASAPAAPRGDDLLRAMLSAERSVSYSATETIKVADGPTVVATVRRRGLKKRIEYSAPPIMKGDVLVDDSANVWRYHRAENSAIKTRTAPRRSAADLRALSRRYDAKTVGQAKIGGRTAWIVAVRSHGQSRVLRKFWIDEKSKIRLRLELYDARGRRIEARALSNLKFAAVPDAVFRFAPPRGARVTNAGTLYTRLAQAQRRASWLRVPASLPRGYAFESAVIDEAKSESWLRYTNGVRRFSIFQQRTGEHKSTPLTRAGNGWYWQKTGDRFLIAGLTEAQAKQVAASIR